MSTLKAPLPSMANYVSPQPMFAPCALCGCLVAMERDALGHAVAVSPLLGYEHLCGENCACKGVEPTP